LPNSDWVTPYTGALNTGGVYKFRDFQPISGYVGNHTRLGRSYYGTLIRNHVLSVELWHFRWSWVWRGREIENIEYWLLIL